MNDVHVHVQDLRLHLLGGGLRAGGERVQAAVQRRMSQDQTRPHDTNRPLLRPVRSPLCHVYHIFISGFTFLRKVSRVKKKERENITTRLITITMYREAGCRCYRECPEDRVCQETYNGVCNVTWPGPGFRTTHNDYICNKE